MRLTVSTWNINSVRLRINLVAKFIKSVRPDVLCLQETKCPDDAFPLKRFKRLGYEHVALNGQKGYHGVAIVSRHPFDKTDMRSFCGRIDSRHISVSLGHKIGLEAPVTIHNFYVPSGGDIPDPSLNPKFEHKLAFLDEMKTCEPLHPADGDRHVLVGDLNVAPHEHDVWSHKQLLNIVSQRPSNARSCSPYSRAATGSMSRVRAFPSLQKSIPGGAIAPPTGRCRIAAAGSTTSGFHRRWANASAISRSRAMHAAGTGRPIMCR